VDGDVLSWLRSAPTASVDAFHLSNLGDWVDGPAWDEVLTEVVRVGAPGARIVWRCMHADRPVPAALLDRIHTDRAWGLRLRALDRFPFYVIVPAEIA
jgi:S-adenosylmethionine:diacylglycerol 3-amino-3-carboxypropyl transferase